MKAKPNLGWTIVGVSAAPLPVALACIAFQRRVTQGFMAASGLKG